MSVTFEEFEEAQSNDMGYCTECKDFTRECTEPDAENYDCPECGSYTVFGAKQAMLMGLILTDDDLEDEEE
jgi:Zn finger protein HypA/HybF involved in hydrogenase expression